MTTSSNVNPLDLENWFKVNLQENVLSWRLQKLYQEGLSTMKMKDPKKMLFDIDELKLGGQTQKKMMGHSHQGGMIMKKIY
jgi:hypothetical protein